MNESDALVAANSLLRNFGIILAGGTPAGVLAKYLRVPDVAVLLLVGILLGPIFQQVPIRERVAQTVMSESAFNDATGADVIAAVTFIAILLTIVIQATTDSAEAKDVPGGH